MKDTVQRRADVRAADWWSDLRRVLRREALLFTSELLFLLPLLQGHAKNARVHLLGCSERVKERKKTNKLPFDHWLNIKIEVKHFQQEGNAWQQSAICLIFIAKVDNGGKKQQLFSYI